MNVIGADGLSLLVGDGLGPENFYPLKGANVTQLEITQQNHPTGAIGADAWLASGGVADRQAKLECTALATDDISALRLRSVTLGGLIGNFKLMVNMSETMSFSAVVTRYREVIEAGAMKTLYVRLESSGMITIG